MEGKVARVATSESGMRASFKSDRREIRRIVFYSRSEASDHTNTPPTQSAIYEKTTSHLHLEFDSRWRSFRNPVDRGGHQRERENCRYDQGIQQGRYGTRR